MQPFRASAPYRKEPTFVQTHRSSLGKVLIVTKKSYIVCLAISLEYILGIRFFNISPVHMYEGANLTLPWKSQRSNYDEHLNKLGRPWIPDGIYHDSSSTLSCFWRRTFLSVFTTHVHGGHTEQFDQLVKPFRQKAPCSVWWKFARAFSDKTFKNYTIHYMYTAQRQGQITPRGQNSDYN